MDVLVCMTLRIRCVSISVCVCVCACRGEVSLERDRRRHLFFRVQPLTSSLFFCFPFLISFAHIHQQHSHGTTHSYANAPSRSKFKVLRDLGGNVPKS